MKKLVVLLSAVVLLLTGCSVVQLDASDIGKNMKILLSDDVELYNVHFDGYKYFVPKGLIFLNKEEYNAIFTDKYNNKYYLYVDAIGYYHKNEIEYKVENNIHYSKLLDYNDKTGYIRIEKQDEQYFIQFVFNYAKMEAYVSENDLASVVTNMCYILRTIEFNDAVLESLIGENILSYKEEEFTLFENSETNEIFLQTADPESIDDEEDVFEDNDFNLYDDDDSVFDE